MLTGYWLCCTCSFISYKAEFLEGAGFQSSKKVTGAPTFWECCAWLYTLKVVVWRMGGEKGAWVSSDPGSFHTSTHFTGSVQMPLDWLTLYLKQTEAFTRHTVWPQLPLSFSSVLHPYKIQTNSKQLTLHLAWSQIWLQSVSFFPGDMLIRVDPLRSSRHSNVTFKIQVLIQPGSWLLWKSQFISNLIIRWCNHAIVTQVQHLTYLY